MNRDGDLSKFWWQKFFLLLLFFPLFIGCTRDILTVHTDYLSHENLASYRVGTPDPTLNNPPIGQRLIISWSVPCEYMEFADLHLLVTMRFRNREQLVQKVELLKASGIYVYAMINDDYFEKGGILTYKVELFGDEQLLDVWLHQLWVELIVFEEQPETT